MEIIRIMKRREFVKKSASICMMAPLMGHAATFPALRGTEETRNIICTFSKTFQWLNYEDLAGFLADAGFDGIDLSVRPGGHVFPENVERDLPAAVESAQKRGLTIPMMVTAITDASDPLTERVLKTASQTGIKYYRLGYYHYDNKLNTEQNMERIKKQMLDLCELNARYGLQGGYQNHAGSFFGSPVWDLWYLIRDFDPRYIGCQYDVRHAAAEGVVSWPLGFEAIASHVKHACIKDYNFVQNNKGKWDLRSVPLGTGVVDYKQYFNLRRKHGVYGPLSIHYEFDLEGDDETLSGKERIKKIFPSIRREVEVLKTLIKES
jgi:sugar phosphate isomerase/epimerase